MVSRLPCRWTSKAWASIHHTTPSRGWDRDHRRSERQTLAGVVDSEVGRAEPKMVATRGCRGGDFKPANIKRNSRDACTTQSLCDKLMETICVFLEKGLLANPFANQMSTLIYCTFHRSSKSCLIKPQFNSKKLDKEYHRVGRTNGNLFC